MGIQQLTLHCPRCNEMTPHTRQTPNHLLHLLLTVFTLGFWLIVWIILAIGSNKAEGKCGKCGSARAA